MKKLLKLMGLLLLTIFLGACQAQNAATPSNQTADNKLICHRK